MTRWPARVPTATGARAAAARLGGHPGDPAALLELGHVVLPDAAPGERHREHPTCAADALPGRRPGQVVAAVRARLLSPVGDQLEDRARLSRNLTAGTDHARSLLLRDHASAERPPAREAPDSFENAEHLARDIRAEAGRPEGPLPDLQSVAESLGLLGFSLALGPDAGDAAYVEVGKRGVAVINGTTDPGRRRFSLAHELGHHLTGDAYEPSPRLGASDTERMLNAFAAYLLMPRPSVLSVWDEFSAQSPRLAAIAVAVRFSVSWTAACNQLRNLDLIDSRDRERLVADDLRRGELFEFCERFAIELEPPSVPPASARAVVSGYRRGQLTAAKTVELLHQSVGEADLPEPGAMSLDELRGQFDVEP